MSDTDQEKMDAVLRRMLATPPTPHKTSVTATVDQFLKSGQSGTIEVRATGGSVAVSIAPARPED